jgi:purine-nucleoside phosphorylase
MTADILFVAAEPRECEPFVRRWSGVSEAQLPVRWSRAGAWKGRRCVVIANGAGTERAALAAAAVEAPVVCSIGFCGALDPGWKPGEIFVASEVRNGTRRWKTASATADGPLQTAPKIIASRAEKAALRAQGSLAVEMEASAVAKASEERGASYYCIRAVSDLAGETFVNDFNACLLPDGRFDTVRLVRGAILSPARLAELIRLARRTSLAARNLGDYLERCEF